MLVPLRRPEFDASPVLAHSVVLLHRMNRRLLRGKRTNRLHRQIDEIDPNVWSGRASQEVLVELAVGGLASMYPASDWSSLSPGHHGNQHACDLISGQASTGHPGHQCSQAPGKPFLHLFSSSRRPRRAIRLRQGELRLAPNDQAGREAASTSLPAAKLRPWARTLHAMRASLLASAIASTLRCSRLLAASIQGLSP